MIAGLYPIFSHWHNRPGCTVYIYSDPHFGDKDLQEYVPSRPSDEEHVALINSKVGRNDTLILLGDIGNPEYVKQLRGYKILIAGNHEVGLTKYDDIFDEIYSGALIIGEKLILSHEPVDVPWALNLHGHEHQFSSKQGKRHFNVNGDARHNYTPINLNQFMKEGHMSHIESIHRTNINKAIKRKKKRGNK